MLLQNQAHFLIQLFAEEPWFIFASGGGKGGEPQESHIKFPDLTVPEYSSTNEPVSVLWRSSTGLSQINLAFFGWLSTNTAGKFAMCGFPAPSPHRFDSEKPITQMNPTKANHFGYEPMDTPSSFLSCANFLWTCMSFQNIFVVSQECSSPICNWKRSTRTVLLSPKLSVATNY